MTFFLNKTKKYPKKHLPTEYDVKEFPLIQLDKDQGVFLSVVRTQILYTDKCI